MACRCSIHFRSDQMYITIYSSKKKLDLPNGFHQILRRETYVSEDSPKGTVDNHRLFGFLGRTINSKYKVLYIEIFIV